jgi:integrase/recombinase XerD
VFLEWCEGKGITDIEGVQPVHVAAYIEELATRRKAPAVKQHLACLRMLFDWLVTGQVIAANAARAVRGPRHSVIKGATTVMSSAETSAFLKSIDTSHVVGLRDRAFIGVMVYAFARVSAVVPVTDGVFPEAKEFLAGYWVVDVESADRAYQIAAWISGVRGPGGTPLNMPIEVRRILSGEVCE